MTPTPVTNSYIETIEDCDARLEDDPRATAFLILDDGPKTWYLQEATRVIDALPLRGERYEPYWIKSGSQYDVNADGLTQVLEFPRFIDGVVVDWDYGTELPIIPTDVIRACLEEALALYAFYSDSDNVDRKSAKDQGVQNYNLGGVYSESLGSSVADKNFGLRSMAAYRLLKKYIEMNPHVL